MLHIIVSSVDLWTGFTRTKWSRRLIRAASDLGLRSVPPSFSDLASSGTISAHLLQCTMASHPSPAHHQLVTEDPRALFGDASCTKHEPNTKATGSNPFDCLVGQGLLIPTRSSTPPSIEPPVFPTQGSPSGARSLVSSMVASAGRELETLVGPVELHGTGSGATSQRESRESGLVSSLPAGERCLALPRPVSGATAPPGSHPSREK